jgi:hypothetical protein
MDLLLILTPIYNNRMTAISLHPQNPHYLAYRGQALLMVSSGEHYGAVINRAFDAHRYLDALAHDGMRYTRLFAGSYLEELGAFGIRENTLAPGDRQLLAPWARSTRAGYAQGGARFDLQRWDEDYFTRLKDFLEQAGRRGVVVELTLFSSIYRSENWRVCPFHPANNVNGAGQVDFNAVHSLDNGGLLAYQESLVRKLVVELNPFDNLIYEIQNEPWSDRPALVDEFETRDVTLGHAVHNKVEVADAASLAWQARVVGWIRESEAGLPNRHLIAQNICNFRTRVADVHPAVNVLNFHYAWPEAALWNLDHQRVINFDESGFAGSADEAYRRQAWRFLLAGGGVFNNLDYSFFMGHEDGDGVNQAPGGGGPTLRRQLLTLGEFASRYDFVAMRPSAGEAPGVRVLRSADQALMYLEGPTALTLTLPPGAYRAAWLDPLQGELVGEQWLVCGEDGLLALQAPQALPELAVGLRPA